MRAYRCLLRFGSLLLISTLISGCFSTHGRPVAGLSDGKRRTLQVTLSDGSNVQLRSAVVGSDAIIGDRLVLHAFGHWSVVRDTVPASEVQAVEVSRLDVPRTVLLLAGVSTAALVLVVWGVSQMQWTDGGPGLLY
jgi:hypothetical protein